ncbi:MAG: hypothetical protein Q8932_07605 [Bacteroidota bacterium]|nr:hypothetical protein [Bacteroidota bacterium]MDP4254101.1 hypothetical protein [Bacteroidota bacterium]MDP4260335.1 hypothetical protein [Bacteroidota bacterium]
MKTIKLLPASAALIAIALIAGCKKNKETRSDCHIVAITSTTGESYYLTYNKDGKLASDSSGNSVTTFVYSGSTVTGTTNMSGAFSSKTIITLNSNGLASNVRTEYNAAGTNWGNALYEYSGTEVVKVTNTSSSGGSPTLSTIAWSNGNPTSITSGSSTSILDYYTDKAFQKGDYLYLAQLTLGYTIYTSKNLLKSIVSGSTLTTVTYSFDSDGKINMMTVSSGSNATTVLVYQYQCN